jgi:hypothetical protein
VKHGLEMTIFDMEVGTYLKKLADYVHVEVTFDEIYHMIHDIVGMLDSVILRCWLSYAERSMTLSDIWDDDIWVNHVVDSDDDIQCSD